ncbi:EamA family transporter RarD [Bacillus mangrovi]|uniref:EamA family transporter RarD n=1 Tax=Metabacillus mangrovi TaxID=1491830 RepID=A0A7X2S1B5_9BACI|nr:EamA family transporter RarD [Metabacillus mangrovi]MTH51993.1 EamA family transporter RarD [Metabacillus mangrovi]
MEKREREYLLHEQTRHDRKGIWLTAGSYILWGILPVYWKAAETVSSEEILAHRIFWSFIFMLAVITAARNWPGVVQAIKEMKKRPFLIGSLILSSVLISANWFVYIWAVNNHHIVEASLGYYINPLISVLLGVLFLKERLNGWQKLSFVLALAGVLISSIHFGSFPWISVILALSFGLYGLTKKVTKLDPSVGLLFETIVMVPAAVLFLISLSGSGNASFGTVSLEIDLLLIGAGIVTAIPLLLFAGGARRIPLYMTGILQYIAPTLTLLAGVLLYGEAFTAVDLITFSLIWAALLIFTVSSSRAFLNRSYRKPKKASAHL